jgi:uncharacterized membrane-anchored protein YitT (DUF2179 family)
MNKVVEFWGVTPCDLVGMYVSTGRKPMSCVIQNGGTYLKANVASKNQKSAIRALTAVMSWNVATLTMLQHSYKGCS